MLETGGSELFVGDVDKGPWMSLDGDKHLISEAAGAGKSVVTFACSSTGSDLKEFTGEFNVSDLKALN